MSNGVEIPKCQRCFGTFQCYSPDYEDGNGSIFKHWCPRTGYAEFRTVHGYTKAMSYQDAGRGDLADRFRR